MAKIVFEDVQTAERLAVQPAVSVPHMQRKDNGMRWIRSAVFAGIGVSALFMGTIYSKLTGAMMSGFDCITGSMMSSILDYSGMPASIIIAAPSLICAGILFFILLKKNEAMERPLILISASVVSAILSLAMFALIIAGNNGSGLMVIPGPGCIASLAGSIGTAVTVLKNNDVSKRRFGFRPSEKKGQISYLR